MLFGTEPETLATVPKRIDIPCPRSYLQYCLFQCLTAPLPPPFTRRTDRCPRVVAIPCIAVSSFRPALLATAAATTLTQGAVAAQVAGEQAAAATKKTELPRRMLGKTGVEVTLVDQGTVRQPDALDQLLRYSFSRGVRYFDTAAAYRTEPAFKKWFTAMPEVRKQIFLATKDGVGRPGDMVKKIDQRLAAIGTDYIDLLFFHGLDQRNRSTGPRARR